MLNLCSIVVAILKMVTGINGRMCPYDIDAPPPISIYGKITKKKKGHSSKTEKVVEIKLGLPFMVLDLVYKYC